MHKFKEMDFSPGLNLLRIGMESDYISNRQPEIPAGVNVFRPIRRKVPPYE